MTPPVVAEPVAEPDVSTISGSIGSSSELPSMVAELSLAGISPQAPAVPDLPMPIMGTSADLPVAPDRSIAVSSELLLPGTEVLASLTSANATSAMTNSILGDPAIISVGGLVGPEPFGGAAIGGAAIGGAAIGGSTLGGSPIGQSDVSAGVIMPNQNSMVMGDSKPVGLSFGFDAAASKVGNAPSQAPAPSTNTRKVAFGMEALPPEMPREIGEICSGSSPNSAASPSLPLSLTSVITSTGSINLPGFSSMLVSDAPAEAPSCMPPVCSTAGLVVESPLPVEPAMRAAPSDPAISSSLQQLQLGIGELPQGLPPSEVEEPSIVAPAISSAAALPPALASATVLPQAQGFVPVPPPTSQPPSPQSSMPPALLSQIPSQPLPSIQSQGQPLASLPVRQMASSSAPSGVSAAAPVGLSSGMGSQGGMVGIPYMGPGMGPGPAMGGGPMGAGGMGPAMGLPPGSYSEPPHNCAPEEQHRASTGPSPPSMQQHVIGANGPLAYDQLGTPMAHMACAPPGCGPLAYDCASMSGPTPSGRHPGSGEKEPRSKKRAGRKGNSGERGGGSGGGGERGGGSDRSGERGGSGSERYGNGASLAPEMGVMPPGLLGVNGSAMGSGSQNPAMLAQQYAPQQQQYAFVPPTMAAMPYACGQYGGPAGMVYHAAQGMYQPANIYQQPQQFAPQPQQYVPQPQQQYVPQPQQQYMSQQSATGGAGYAYQPPPQQLAMSGSSFNSHSNPGYSGYDDSSEYASHPSNFGAGPPAYYRS